MGSDPKTPQGPDEATLDYVIQNEWLLTHYQPICSVGQRQIVGSEALTRGRDERTGRILPPLPLFQYAERSGQAVEFDRLCRRKALETYAQFVRRLATRHVLFLNVDTAAIDSRMAQGATLLDEVQAMGLQPGNVVVEFRESSVHDEAALLRFSEHHRECGFLIALDDIGTGESNLERISILKPDILKIDRSLVSGIAQEYHKQEIFRSLTNMAHRIGALVVAEGVETPSDALACLDARADMLQGFFLGKPTALDETGLQLAKESTAALAGQFREYLLERIRQRQAESKRLDEIVGAILNEAAAAPRAASSFDALLERLVEEHTDIESVYILSRDGIQRTRRVMGAKAHAAQSRRPIIEVSDKGADRSHKPYVFLLRAGLRRYVTEPYISVQTGMLCRAVSTSFRTLDGESYILCVSVACP